MKTKIILIFLIISFTEINCKKEKEHPEDYTKYLSISITKEPISGSSSDSLIQIYIKNDSDNEFLRECSLNYSLNDSLTKKNYYDQEIFSNQKNPELSNGLLKLDRRGTIFKNVNLNNINWSGTEFKKLSDGRYILEVSLFIKDPYSPTNIILSNRLIIKK